MKSQLHNVVLTALVVEFIVSVGWAQPTCENTFTGSDQEIWQSTDNWSAEHLPEDDEVACIPPGITVLIDGANAIKQVQAEAVYVQTDAQEGPGAIVIEKETTLTLCADEMELCVDSQLDGTIQILESAGLVIANDHEIVGNGGVILGERQTSLVTDDAESPLAVLRLTPTNNSDPSTSITVHGSMTIEVQMTNDVYVIADDPVDLFNPSYFGIILSEEVKDGSGFWMAANDGLLEINVEVSGPAAWKIEDEDQSTIRIKANCPDLTGPVTLTEGILELYRLFSTDGDLQMKSVNDSLPKIISHGGDPNERGGARFGT